ncbi:MAG TPA: LUD domain-containing protein [Terriglobales bacterium]|nr:LUD domain-containing protein [Terriglobales bacterium]
MAGSNPQRERILARVRAATADNVPTTAPAASKAPIFAEIPDPLERFLRECAANLTEVICTRDSMESAAACDRVLQSLPPGELFFQDTPVFRSWASHVDSARTVRWSSGGPPSESTQATFTLAHGFVAQTGSILSSSLCGGRGASIVAPCHVVFGTTEQVVADIDAALQIANHDLLSASYVGLISGSSRTADIEKILVQGAHGPLRVVVILQAAS